MLSAAQLDDYRRTGHLTVAGMFSEAEIDTAHEDLVLWAERFVASMPKEKRAVFLERGGSSTQLRKLDHPVYLRPVFQRLAQSPRLLKAVQQLIGDKISVFYSQIFMKPPEGGGPKPIHQDNFYFGPVDRDSTLTVWVALDEATEENGCLFYAEAQHQDLIPHAAPPDEPFNLQIDAGRASGFDMVAAPVPRGGVSFHHGNTPHQSATNRSRHPRRAAVFHYVRNRRSMFVPAPGVEVDPAMSVKMD